MRVQSPPAGTVAESGRLAFGSFRALGFIDATKSFLWGHTVSADCAADALLKIPYTPTAPKTQGCHVAQSGFAEPSKAQILKAEPNPEEGVTNQVTRILVLLLLSGLLMLSRRDYDSDPQP